MDRPRLLTLHNGSRVQPTFSEAEMTARNQRLRDYMSEQGIDSTLFTSIHNINYFSDFVYCSFGRNFGLVVTQDAHTTISANVDTASLLDYCYTAIPANLGLSGVRGFMGGGNGALYMTPDGTAPPCPPDASSIFLE